MTARQRPLLLLRLCQARFCQALVDAEIRLGGQTERRLAHYTVALEQLCLKATASAAACVPLRKALRLSRQHDPAQQLPLLEQERVLREPGAAPHACRPNSQSQPPQATHQAARIKQHASSNHRIYLR